MKKVLKIVGVIIVGVVVLLSALYFGLSWYGDWQFNRDIKKITEETNRPYLEDTYGGKTPQETLQLFITAVEKEDFELASKYFIFSKQEEWRKALVRAKETNKLDEFLRPVKIESEKLKKEEPLWETRNNYASGDDVLFQFVKYPNVWKIKEI